MDEMIVYDGAVYQLSKAAISQLVAVEQAYKAAEEAHKNMKGALLAEMEKRGILSLKTETVTVTRVPETVKETFDSKRFHDEHPEMYDDYVRESDAAAYVKITLKGAAKK